MAESNYTYKKSNITFVPSVHDPYDKGSPNHGAAYTANINPESIKHSRAVKVNNENVSNTAYDVFQFKGYGKETVALQLIIDGTGFINNSAGTVSSQIRQLLDCIYLFKSESHKCHFIQIKYGDVFETKWWNVESLDINYTLFDKDGNPLIAEVDLSFVIHRNKKALQQADPPFSPDVTHVFTFKEGDSLTAMCHEIYDDLGYYVQVAKMNGLTNFRNIPVGTRIYFPPLINLS